jgi:hypothetical protein
MAEVYDSTEVRVWEPANPDKAQNPAEIARIRHQHAVVLTAWNPGHERPTSSVNDEANNRMFEVLQATGYPIWPADGASPDGAFHEPGFCVWNIPIEEALVIARDFRQYAVYLYQSDGSRETVWA